MLDILKPELVAPEPPDEFYGGHLPGLQRGFDGKRLVSEEEWKEAMKGDPYLIQIDDYVAQDRAYILHLKGEIAMLMAPIRKLRSKILMVRHRIESRKRQHKHFAKLLRVKLAYAKIKEIRKKSGID